MGMRAWHVDRDEQMAARRTATPGSSLAADLWTAALILVLFVTIFACIGATFGGASKNFGCDGAAACVAPVETPVPVAGR